MSHFDILGHSTPENDGEYQSVGEKYRDDFYEALETDYRESSKRLEFVFASEHSGQLNIADCGINR
ncbi:hypothetical protein [Rhodopirellula sp. SWK7]|uniref:hypothetical protein n=1 Tax=Rhodopirellula sp. SWK7 TaxID=595460 RepID=UPI0002BF7EC5|nr:hypothetical protein [Rhodopirellula sp. SWK7]EMI45339.1 hypothetical protein RRSWK_02127 [Rhodopirellula sp. SWK7]